MENILSSTGKNPYISLRTRESLYEEIDALKATIEALSVTVDDQSKIESRIEVTVNYISGFVLAWATLTWIVTPLVTVGVLTWDDGFAITSVFTVVSILRSYYWRRFFAKNLHKVVHKFVTGFFK